MTHRWGVSDQVSLIRSWFSEVGLRRTGRDSGQIRAQLYANFPAAVAEAKIQNPNSMMLNEQRTWD